MKRFKGRCKAGVLFPFFMGAIQDYGEKPHMLSTKMSDLIVISCSESSAAFYVPGKIKIPLPAESHQLIIISFY